MHPRDPTELRMPIFIRGSQCHRQDTADHKGVITIIRNNIPSTNVLRNLEELGHLIIKLYATPEPKFITNFYYPSKKRLDLSKIQISESYHMPVEDFISHSLGCVI